MLDVPTWLIYLTATLLLVSSVTEFRGRGLPSTFTVTALSMFDSGFVLVTVAALVLGWRMGAHYAGELWFGYQAIASPVLVIATISALRHQRQQQRSRIGRP